VFQSLREVAGLTLTRVARRDRSAPTFDVTSADRPDDRDRVSTLLDRHASLSGQMHVLTAHSWKLLWAEGRRGYLPFHECRATLVAWRDPVGPVALTGPLLAAFQQLARSRGKHALLLGMSKAAVDHLVPRGFRSIWIGREPFFDLATWHPRGKAGEKVRLACNHVRRVGASSREAFPSSDVRDREAIARVERAWKAARPERNNDSFLRTRPMENAHLRRYFVVETPARMESFLVCSPVSARGWYLQDLVRLPDAPRGAAELALRTAIETFQRDRFNFATGGIVPFFDPDGAHAADAGARSGPATWVIPYFDRLFHFHGMQQFRAKFSASRLVDVYALYWPGILTPLVAWDIRTLLS
jgi:phosphatidylglycerol lysyltransferase